MGKTKTKINHFTDVDVWRESHGLFLRILKDLERLPRSRAANILIDQIVRSAGSVGANIAEGFNRSKARFVNALDIALGELHELENWLYKVRDAGYLARTEVNNHVRDCVRLGKMLTSLSRSIRSRPG